MRGIMVSLLFLLLLPVTALAIPYQINPTGERMIVISPRYHFWAAYSGNGQLIRSGIASTGKSYCHDIGRSCRTPVGAFRVYSLGGPGCKSTRYPLGRGGAPMPYCMFFKGNQAIHGSYEVARANLSHGCVRVNVRDAAWLRYNFIRNGTIVRVLPY